ncbi:MAG: hypothetical protein ACFCVH_08395, partial [Alphaproteobacteria bacterium]
MAVRALLLPTLAAVLVACATGERYHTAAPVPTNGPAASFSNAAWTAQEHRITHSQRVQMMPMGEYAACDFAKRELANDSAG